MSSVDDGLPLSRKSPLAIIASGLLAAVVLAVVLVPVGFVLLHSISKGASASCVEVAMRHGADEGSSWFEIGAWPPHWICKTNRGTYDMGFWAKPGRLGQSAPGL